MANTANVSAGKPKIGGAISVAEVGTTLPTTADGTLDNAFANLGYISDDGLTNSNSPSSTKIKSWGGETVLTVQDEKEDTFSFTLLEVLDENVLKTIYGNDNVSNTNGTITVTANSKETEAKSWVVDMVMNSGYLKRIVIPNGKISEIGDITYSDGAAVGYELTIDALPDASGNNHYEYLKSA